jgi:hypothetical protein
MVLGKAKTLLKQTIDKEYRNKIIISVLFKSDRFAWLT